MRIGMREIPTNTEVRKKIKQGDEKRKREVNESDEKYPVAKY